MDAVESRSRIEDPVAHWPIWKQCSVRLLVLVLPVVIAIDALPTMIPGIDFPKYYISPVLRSVGLWQGEWTLFAPNPSINNGWISAEIDGIPSISDPSTTEILTWNSPYWSRVTSWEKFYRFRYVNFYNRLPFREQDAANDFSEFIARETLGSRLSASRVAPLRRAGEPATEGTALLPVGPEKLDIEVRLYHNNLTIILPEDGSLPSRDEETWMAVSRNLTIWKFQP